MSDPKTYFQPDILNRPLQKHGLLEEFNLSPKTIAFIRYHRRNVVIGLCCVAVALVGWSSYDHYRNNQNDHAASRLSSAVGQADPVKRQALLEALTKESPSTGSATWATLELGHLARDAGKLDDALAKYQQVRDSLSSASPIMPLVQLTVAQTLEAKQSSNEALVAYQKLVDTKGFAGEAYLGMARIHEQQGAAQQAREMYNRVLAMEEISAAIKDQVKDRLARL